NLATKDAKQLAENIEPTRNLDRFFSLIKLAPDTTLALYYTDRRRESAEVYFNDYSHVMLFSPRYPGGLKLLSLSIDQGTIDRWVVQNKVLHLETNDGRKHKRQIY